MNVPIGVAVLLCTGLLPGARDMTGRTLDLPGLLVLTPAVLAFVLPLVLGQPLGWPAWGWALLLASVVLFVLLGFVEHRVAAGGGQPILPRSLLGLPGVLAGIGGLFAAMVVFGGWLFGFALELQDGLGESALRAGLTFVAGRGGVRAGQPQLAAASRAVPRGAAGRRVRGERARAALAGPAVPVWR